MDFLQQLFKRYQQQQQSSQEKELVDHWYDAAGNTPKPDWMTQEHVRDRKADTWNKITHNLRLENTVAPVAKRNPVRFLLRYAAAAIILGAGLWGIIQWITENTGATPSPVAVTTFTAAPGKQKHIILTDGTEIWLNNGSSLQVRNMEAGDNAREVWLSEGEAYFQVAKDPSKPFTVYVDSLKTRVLGTAFNIQAYRKLSKIQVAVTEGKVQVGYGKDAPDTLTHNMQLDYQPATGMHHVVQKDLSAQSNWRDGGFILDRSDFEELALRIKLRYGMAVKSDNKRFRNAAFSAGFKTDTRLETVMETLCALYGTHYTIKKDTIFIY